MQRGSVPNIETQFFGQNNQSTLYGSLVRTLQQSVGPLNEKQQQRVGKTLAHYMQEIWDVNGPEPIGKLNREVMNACVADYERYLRRETVMPPTVAASQTYVSEPSNMPLQDQAARRLAIQQNVQVPPRPTFEQGLLMDTGSRFERLQQERTPPAETRPPIPDFQISLTTSGDELSSITLFEQAKKAREEEANRVLALSKQMTGTANSDVSPLARFINPPSVTNDGNGNPTLALPTVGPAPRGPLPQDYLIKQDDIISYREVEYNLFLYSADRDWLANTKETRYSFTVNFDTGNTRQGFNFSPSATKKFKNIQRIELVKAIMPTEGLQNIVQYTTTPSAAYINDAKLNILSFPYIIVRIPELDTNNFGTDNNLDNAFGVLQYDANWYSDSNNLSDGYLAMIPKFMKCQKVYHPTPLATLTKLTVELQRPDGQAISTIPDTVQIQNIYASVSASFPASFVYAGNYSNVSLTSGAMYYLIQTGTWFSQWMFQPGNRIQIKGLDATQIAANPTQAQRDFAEFINRDEGHILIAIAQNVAGASSVSDIPNSVGYANVIVIQAPLAPVQSATPDVAPFGGTAATNSALATALRSTTFTTSKLINLTHQTNLVLRIITREMDPTARVRPDNL
jgi:hypothetical protein